MKKALLAVSYGAASAAAVEKCIEPMERAVFAAFPGRDCFRVFTSRGLIRRCGLDIMDLEAARAMLAEEEYGDVLICPLLLLPGGEYEKIAEAFAAFPGRVRMGKPLMTGPAELAGALAAMLPAKSENTAAIFVGHGSPECAEYYEALEESFHSLGREDVRLGVLWGMPDAACVTSALPKAVDSILLYPLLLTAGVHARRDICGDTETSWKSALRSAGYSVECFCRGLGESPEICRLFKENALKCED